MSRFRFPIAVAITSLALVAILVGVGGLLVGNVLAGGPPWLGAGGPWHGGPWNGGPWHGGGGFGAGFALPQELEGLRDVPADQRFAHFRGVQVNLTDRDNNPLTINVTPGTATAVSDTSLTIAANDGSTQTYTLEDRTVIRGKLARGGAQATQPALAQNDRVVVVTVGNSPAATAVMLVGADGFGPPWHGGRSGSGR